MLPSGKWPSPTQVAWFPGCPSSRQLPTWSDDHQEHDPTRANQDSRKGTNMGVGREGRSPSEFLHFDRCHAAWSGLVPSSMPHAGSCLRKNQFRRERTREGILVTTLDLLDLAGPEAAAPLGPPHLKPHISLCCNTSLSWVSSPDSEGPVRIPFSEALAVWSVWVVEKGNLSLGGRSGEEHA